MARENRLHELRERSLMPTYNYRCTTGHPYSEYRGMTDPQQRTTCPKPDCGATLLRVFESTPITFKGRGFYSTGG